MRNYAAITIDAARYLAECGVKTIGVDYLSIERADSPDVHKVLLGAGIGAIEGLDLSAVAEGEYFLSALPIKVAGAEGAPVRAVLTEL
jgi:arylformamidase